MNDEMPMDQGEAPPQQPPEPNPMAEPAGEQGPSHSLFIEPSMLPEGMAATMKPGDILEFKYVGTDKDGDIEVQYNHGKGEQDDSKEWEDNFRKHMSPTSDETPTVPEQQY